MELTKRQEKILAIVKEEGPITGEHIADKLYLTRATLRPDLAILTMAGFLGARPRVGYFFTGSNSNQLLEREIKKRLVKDYKAVPVVVTEATSAYDAVVTMFLEDVGTLFVVKDKGILAGVVSRKDLLKVAIGKQDLQSIPVSIVMTRMPNIVTCQLEESLFEAAKKLIDYQIDAMPVVREVHEGEGVVFEVVGRVTKTTMTKAYVELGAVSRI